MAIVLGAIAVAADFGARVLVQNLAGRALASHRGVNGSVDVSLGGFPFLLRLIDRSFPTLTVEADDVRSGGFDRGRWVEPATEVQIESVRLELEDVTVRGDLWGDDPDRVVAADSGNGVATVEAPALNRLVPDEYAARLQLLDGLVRVTAATPAGEQTVEVSEGDVVVEQGAAAGTLVIRAPSPLRPVLIPLPPLVSGTTFSGVDVQRGRIRLTFSLSDVRLSL